MPDTTLQDALQHAVEHSKKNFKEKHVLVGYVLCLVAWVGALFLLIEKSKGAGWVTALYFALVPLIHTIAALTDIHVLHFWSLFIIWTLSSSEQLVYTYLNSGPAQNSLLGVGYQLVLIGGLFSIATIHQVWENFNKIKETWRSPFGILAIVAWVITLAGCITTQIDTGSSVLGINTAVMVVATVFLLGRLVPVQGLNSSISLFVAQVFVVAVIETCGSKNVSQAGFAVTASGLVIMILVLVVADFLRHHKPEDLGPEIRAKIADIANSVPLLLSVICTIVALAGFITAIIWYNSQPGASNFNCAITPYFTWCLLLLVCLFNTLAILLGTYMFNYIAFGWLLYAFPVTCLNIHIISTSAYGYWGLVALATAALLSMFSHNFIDTVKRAPEKVKQVNAGQLILLGGSFFLLLGAVCLLFVTGIISALGLPMTALYLMMFALVIVFFDTSNLPIVSMGVAGALSFSALAAAATVKDSLEIAGATFVYIGTIVVAFALALRGSDHHKKSDESDTPGERTALF